MDALLGVLFYVLFYGSILLIVVSSFRAARSGPTLVLKRLDFNPGGSGQYLVHVVGRPQGLLGWLLAKLGLDDDTELMLESRRVRFESSSLFGRVAHMMPLRSVASTSCAFKKPIGLLVFAALLVLAGFPLVGVGLIESEGAAVGLGFLCVVVGGVCGVLYVLLKSLAIEVTSAGGTTFKLSFKRSVIENVPLDISKAEQVINLISAQVTASQSGREERG